MIDCHEIGKRIRTLREHKNWTQEQLANIISKKCSCSRSLVVAWENGDRSIKIDHLLVLSEIFDTSCDYILRGVNTENIDICAKTCLTETTLQILIERKRAFQEAQNKIQEYNDDCERGKAEIQKKFDGRDNPDSDEICIIQPIPPEEVKNSIAFQKFERLKSYLTNAFIKNDTLLDKLKVVLYDLLHASASYIDDSLYYTNEFWPVFTSADYQKALNANLYAATRSFGEFIESICSNTEFIKMSGMLDDEKLKQAIKKGLLHE